MKKMGKFEIITGPMFTEKSLELIKRAKDLEAEGKSYIAFSPIKDVIFSRAVEETIDAVLIDKELPMLIPYHAGMTLGRYDQLDTVIIDEIQFYNHNIVDAIHIFLINGIHVVAAGLDLTSTVQPFGVMGDLLCLADKITKKKTTCTVCGAAANRSQRLLNGEPAPFTAPIIIVDGSNADYTYEPRCSTCFEKA